jgi:hypothetical protein
MKSLLDPILTWDCLQLEVTGSHSPSQYNTAQVTKGCHDVETV